MNREQTNLLPPPSTTIPHSATMNPEHNGRPVPMACIGGILMYMVKPAEAHAEWGHNRFEAGLMTFIALMVVGTDFLFGVVSALALYAILQRFFERPREELPYEDWHVTESGDVARDEARQAVVARH